MTVVDWQAVDRAAEYRTRPRSWSQLSSWEQCPKAFYLERILQVWQRPAAWFSTGNAVHKAVELLETEGLDEQATLAAAQRVYREDVNERLVETPNPDAWSASGRYKGSSDIPRRYEKLPEHLDNYRAMRAKLPPIIELTGKPAVEEELSIQLDGVVVHGFADQIREGLMVDVKAGSTVPKDTSQLRLYAMAVEDQGGPVIEKAVFLMTATGRVLEYAFADGEVTPDQIARRFKTMDDAVKHSDFDPTPGDQCRRCSVWASCTEGRAHTTEARQSRR